MSFPLIKLLHKYPYLWIILLAALFFVPFLGRVPLFDWDELIFAEVAREMQVSGNYEWIRINFQPFWEKPPLFFWLQALSMQLFGVGEFAARFPNAICGMLSLCLIYYLGKRLENIRLAILWVFTYALAILPHFYYKTGIIDPWFNLFIFSGIASWLLYFSSQQKLKYILIAGIILGLGTLTKGPVAILLSTITIGILSLWRYKHINYPRFLWHTLVVIGLCLAVVSCWVIAEVYANGWWFVQTFWDYQIGLMLTSYDGHKGFWGYHFIILSVGCFPAIAFMWNGISHFHKSIFSIVMLILLGLVLLVFSIVKTKLVHYSSLTYYPISYFAASGIAQAFKQGRFNFATKFHLLVVGLLWGIVLFSLPILLYTKPLWLMEKIAADPVLKGNFQAEVDWNWTLCLWGIGYLALFGYALWELSFKRRFWPALLSMALAILLLIQVILLLWVPRVETMIQGASIEFWQAHQNEDCYVESLYMKSFAPYFYAKVREHNPQQKYYDPQWLLTGKIDKPAYFMCRNIHKSQVLDNAGEGLEFLYEKNGYCFWKRVP